MSGLACLLRHPEVATRSCGDCKTWQYNAQGQIEIHRGKKLRRIGKTPCHRCPKKSPDQAHEYELSPANQKAVDFYYTTRGMNWTNLTESMRSDPIVQRNMHIIDRLIRPMESESSAETLIAPVFAAMQGMIPRPQAAGAPRRRST